MEDISCWETKFKACVYSNKLLDKLLRLNEKTDNKINIIEIKKAIYYAKKYHRDQKRLSGEPYYSHPLEIAYNIADCFFTTDILVTSILHDTIEDTKLTEKMIEYIFGPTIASQVESLTRIKPDRKISSAEMVKQLYAQKKFDLLVVKIFDRLHNMQTITSKPTEKIKQCLEETIKNFISLSIYLSENMPKMQLDQKITNLCYKRLSKKPHMLTNLEMSLNDDFQLPFLIFQSEKYQN